MEETNNNNEKTVKIFSANFGKKYDKITSLSPIITEHSPDIIILQEIVCLSEQLSRATKQLSDKNYIGYGSSVSAYDTKKKAMEKKQKKGLPRNIISVEDNLRNCATTLTFINKDFIKKNEIKQVDTDPGGRYTAVQILIAKNRTITIWNIYGPPEGGGKKQ